MDEESRNTLKSIDSRLSALEAGQKQNKDAFEEILKLFSNFKGFMAILGVMERWSIWVAKMSIAAGIFWWLFKEAIVQAFRGEIGK